MRQIKRNQIKNNISNYKKIVKRNHEPKNVVKYSHPAEEFASQHFKQIHDEMKVFLKFKNTTDDSEFHEVYNEAIKHVNKMLRTHKQWGAVGKKHLYDESTVILINMLSDNVIEVGKKLVELANIKLKLELVHKNDDDTLSDVD